MGLFFKRELTPTDEVESAVAAAHAGPQLPPAAAEAAAKKTVSEIKKDAATNNKAFVAAAIVFIVLLVAAFVAAQMADGQTAEKTFTQALATLTQTLLTAWSAAVVGLVGGEAIGSKT